MPMPDLAGVNVLFVSGFGPLVKDADTSKRFYAEALGLPLEPQPGGAAGYYHTEKLDGVRHFALWPLADAAKSCFGKDAWPQDVPEPHSWMEFDVEDVVQAAAALQKKGYRLLVETRNEPWGQTVCRLLSPEGILIGLVITPWLRG
jgi:catechol 2,3-dioxygenase-like lactoylglutathione lyase family enzyme